MCADSRVLRAMVTKVQQEAPRKVSRNFSYEATLRNQRMGWVPIMEDVLTPLLKLTGFETYGFALGVLAPQIFWLERAGIRFSRETRLKTEHTAAF